MDYKQLVVILLLVCVALMGVLTFGTVLNILQIRRARRLTEEERRRTDV